MAIYKCKMCGGDLHPQENAKLITCEYCGTTQTVCHVDDSRLANLFNRANEQRLLNEFDKAEALYENILVENPHESEAYWGKILCKYGIEYVDDPKTGKKIPTCHRAIYESIYDDQDYQRALRNSDPVSENQYKDEANEIDRLQKNILEIAAKEDPYDVFICYKETDEAGERTQDSVYAQDIYNELTKIGYKVFFSRITLESKLGMEYEPYIFSALQTAKVMLVIGSKYDYFDSVWVKNEWKRFLDLSKKGKTLKVLIPCYANMDAYDLPKDFMMFQGQDLTKIGAIQDIVRGVQKILDKEGSSNISAESLDILLKERNQKNAKNSRAKKIAFVAIPIVLSLLVGIIVVGSLLKKNGSKKTSSEKYEFNADEYLHAYDDAKIIEVTDGIPDCNDYDFFCVDLTDDNVNDYFGFCKYFYEEYDDFGDISESGYVISFKSLAYEKGWYLMAGQDYYERKDKISRFKIKINCIGDDGRNSRELENRLAIVGPGEKSSIQSAYEEGRLEIKSAKGKLWFVSSNTAAVYYKGDTKSDSNIEADEETKAQMFSLYYDSRILYYPLNHNVECDEYSDSDYYYSSENKY